MIRRKELVQKHNPVLTGIEYDSPLSVGNGRLCFTADITGLQSLSGIYEDKGFPLLTMSGWGWHEEPDMEGQKYTLADVKKTEYMTNGRIVSYAVEKKPANEAVYDWVRQNPHHFNLARIGILINGKEPELTELTDIHQELDLYTGCLHSEFSYGFPGAETRIVTDTVCHGEKDVLGFSILVKGKEQNPDKVQIEFAFPYPSRKTKGSDWTKQKKHITRFEQGEDGTVLIERQADDQVWYMIVSGCMREQVERKEEHRFRLCPGKNGGFCFTVAFAKGRDLRNYPKTKITFGECAESGKDFWRKFWEMGGMISFEGSMDRRAQELERRMILSLYLSRLNSCGSMPPQETGLTVNSWYGKSHLEMHFWHQAYLPLWGRGELLRPSVEWYRKILPKAKENAAANGYRGARWPKMVGPEGVDCPSEIATLLVWQQPHILYLLELLYQTESGFRPEEYWEIVFETAEFMADFVVYENVEGKEGRYSLMAPLIPAQECHKPMDTHNPVFEVEYWRFGLKLSIIWAERLGKTVPEKWRDVCENMAAPAVIDGRYPAHENCPDTFIKYAKDHPSMTAALGVLPGERIDRNVMKNTLSAVEKGWDYQSMWGWDFAMMAMSYTRLFDGESAVRTLLCDAPKNFYAKNGHNIQTGRKDLPLYLPGNGSLLFALALMTAGWEGCGQKLPGFAKDGRFCVEAEGINPFPF